MIVKKRITNNVLVGMGVAYIVCALVFFVLVGIKISSLTGQATSGSGTVSITISATETAPVYAPNDTRQEGRVGGGVQGGISFEVEDASYRVKIVEFSLQERTIKVKNTGDITDEFTVEVNNKAIKVLPQSFTLRPGEEQALLMVVASDEPGLVVGRIVMSARFGGTKEIPIIINVESKEVEFTFETGIPEELRMIGPEEGILVDVELGNLRGGYVDMSYIIKDASNRGIFRENELLPVKESLSFQKTVKPPRGLKQGTYVVGVQVNYKEKTKVASSFFTVTEKQGIKQEEPQAKKGDGSLLFFLFIVALFGIYILVTRRRERVTL